MGTFRYLTVELRFSDAAPEEVACALTDTDPETLCDGVVDCFVWAGNLVVVIQRLGLRSDAEFPTGTVEPYETEREQWLTDRLTAYGDIKRAVYTYFYDTPMHGYLYVYERSGSRGAFQAVQKLEYGQGAPYFDLPREYAREAVDYIQSTYGLHVLSYRELGYPLSRNWDFDTADIC